MRKSLLIPDAMICFLWKAVCSETGLYSLGRGQRRRAVKYLAGALLHSGLAAERATSSPTIRNLEEESGPKRLSPSVDRLAWPNVKGDLQRNERGKWLKQKQGSARV